MLTICTAVSKMVVLKIGNTFKNGEMFSNMTPIEYSCSMIVAHLVINPLDAIGIFLNKQNFIYRVLASSIITPYKLLWRLWTHLHVCVRGWLSVFHCHYTGQRQVCRDWLNLTPT